MRIRAVIFDIYKTLLDVQPPPPDAEARWAALCCETFEGMPRLDLAGFTAACKLVIAREHTTAHAAGISYPEIYWPDIVGEVLSESASLPVALRDAFLVRHAGLTHTLSLMPGVSEVLRRLLERGLPLGLASNSQPYTLTELEMAFATAELKADIFHPSLQFLSFEHGFSKPDPHVFRLLMARLRGLGISATETLMVGDRLDNDIGPAKSQGFQTWQISSNTSPESGDWERLSRHLSRCVE
ncbi:MAG: HAD family hydrolase [Verrucomicrobia bacterium]|nr:HAD family hydrolase [Verrucomicrobiota bacterium]